MLLVWRLYHKFLQRVLQLLYVCQCVTCLQPLDLRYMPAEHGPLASLFRSLLYNPASFFFFFLHCLLHKRIISELCSALGFLCVLSSGLYWEIQGVENKLLLSFFQV